MATGGESSATQQQQPPPPPKATDALASVASLETAPVAAPQTPAQAAPTPGGDGGATPGRRGSTRLFVGNLKSEALTKREFREMWEKYGEVMEVAIHRSFGFVQFAQPEALQAAIQGEQGRMIGGKPIDLQEAKNESRRGFDRSRQQQQRRPMMHHRRDARDSREHSRDRGSRDDRDRRDHRRRSRSRSPRRDRRDDRGGRANPRGERHRSGGQQPREVLTPHNGAVVTLILLGEQQRYGDCDVSRGDCG